MRSAEARLRHPTKEINTDNAVVDSALRANGSSYSTSPVISTFASCRHRSVVLEKRTAFLHPSARMSGIFQRQLAEYADYHRDQRNCLMHIIGNPILFMAAVLPLSLLPVTVFGVQTSAAPLLVIPALILWVAWDVGLGLAIVATAIPLLLGAATIANHVSVAAVWLITALLTVVGSALQIVGHQFFERRQPALLDNPIHMLISPMYLFAKLFVALGFRRDLAALLQKSSA
jgi:uncharacterized membrane protein YGL010W